MKQTGHTYLMIVLAVGGLLYGGSLNRTARGITAEARSAEGDFSPAGEKWEYCAVSRAAYAAANRGGAYWISYFKEAGVEVVPIEESASDNGAPVAKAIARLGEEGWEMVGQGELPVRTGRVEALYFKRRKPQRLANQP